MSDATREDGSGRISLVCGGCGASTSGHETRPGAVVEAMERGWWVWREDVSLLLEAYCETCRPGREH